MLTAEQEPPGSSRLNWANIAGIALVSVVYFADIFFRSRSKCYWFDELFTVYLCRLPNFGDVWTAVVHGVDFNPPLFYILTRSSQRLFGDGLIATRLPATLGVWIFGVCLFLFVARRAGVVCGSIAGMFPFFTLAQYYAYEARAHGITLGWCGLALVCWQRTADGRAKNLWLMGFGLSLVGALLTHVYAIYLLVPFAVVEIRNLIKLRRPNWGIVLAMLVAAVPVVIGVYLPLSRMYRASVPAFFFPAAHEVIQSFLVDAIGPAIVVLLVSLALTVLEGAWRAQCPTATANIPDQELLLAVSFSGIPLLGFVGSKLSHGPFIDRYFLSSIAGLAIFLGFAHSRRAIHSWAARLLAGCMVLLMIGDLGTTIYLGKQHRILLFEPSTKLALTTSPSDPMSMYKTVSDDYGGLDILVLPSLEYFYFFEYASPSVVPHLYYAAPSGDVNLGLYEKFVRWAHVGFQTSTLDSFLSLHQRFLLYGNGEYPRADTVEALATAGYIVESARADGGGIMYEYSKRP